MYLNNVAVFVKLTTHQVAGFIHGIGIFSIVLDTSTLSRLESLMCIGNFVIITSGQSIRSLIV